MEMRHLRYLVAVAEELHFGKAAERLHVSLSPVSVAVKEIEEELGVQVFERTSRTTVLTAEGERVVLYAREILARTDALKKYAVVARSGLAGTLALSFISLDSYSFLPDLLRTFTTAFPDVQLLLTESSNDQVIADLVAGSIDIGSVILSATLPSELSWRLTGRYPLVVALPADHHLVSLKRVPVEMLAHERFVMFERHIGPAMFDAVISLCMRHGFSPRLLHARQQHTIVSLVAGAVGVAMVPSCVQVLRRKGVVYRPIEGEFTFVETGMVWRTGSERSVVQEFLKLLPPLPSSQQQQDSAV